MFEVSSISIKNDIVLSHIEAIEPGTKISVIGLKNSPMGHIILDECPIPGYCLVGEENVGYPFIKPLLNEGRLDMAAVAVGISQAALDYSTTCAGRIGLYGRSLASYQGVSFPIADM